MGHDRKDGRGRCETGINSESLGPYLGADVAGDGFGEAFGQAEDQPGGDFNDGSLGEGARREAIWSGAKPATLSLPRTAKNVPSICSSAAKKPGLVIVHNTGGASSRLE